MVWESQETCLNSHFCVAGRGSLLRLVISGMTVYDLDA